eukprot:46459_1
MSQLMWKSYAFLVLILVAPNTINADLSPFLNYVKKNGKELKSDLEQNLGGVISAELQKQVQEIKDLEAEITKDIEDLEAENTKESTVKEEKKKEFDVNPVLKRVVDQAKFLDDESQTKSDKLAGGLINLATQLKSDLFYLNYLIYDTHDKMAELHQKTLTLAGLLNMLSSFIMTGSFKWTYEAPVALLSRMGGTIVSLKPIDYPYDVDTVL